MTHLDAFYDRVAARAGEMVPERSVAWLAGHGLFARALRERLPAGSAAELTAAARRNLAKNLHWVDAFQRVVAVLDAAPRPIPVCPLKGIALLGTVYAAEPEARALTDLDVLVPELLVDEAVARLEQRLALRETPASAAARRRRHERTLEGDRLVVDVHTRLGVGDGSGTAYDALPTLASELHGCAVQRLPDADTLAFLVGHLVRHGPFARLGWVEDALRVAARGSGISAAELWEAATRLHARRVVLAGAVAVRRLAGETFLAGLEPLASPRDRSAAARVASLVWRGLRRDPFGSPASGPLRRLVAALLLADSGAGLRSVIAARLVVRR